MKLELRLHLSPDIYIEGAAADLLIFQNTGNVIADSGAKVLLVDDGAGCGIPQASDIVWQLAGYLDAGATSHHLEGTFLVKTHAAFKTGASLDGRVLAQKTHAASPPSRTAQTSTSRSASPPG